MRRKKILWASVIFFLLSLTSAYSQGYMGYMVTKTLLDSVKVNKLHGAAGLALKVEQTDALKFELDVTGELIYALDKHKFRFSGIFRNVYMLTRPENHITDYKIETTFSFHFHLTYRPLRRCFSYKC